jgi:hypothetical protein
MEKTIELEPSVAEKLKKDCIKFFKENYKYYEDSISLAEKFDLGITDFDFIIFKKNNFYDGIAFKIVEQVGNKLYMLLDNNNIYKLNEISSLEDFKTYLEIYFFYIKT